MKYLNLKICISRHLPIKVSDVLVLYFMFQIRYFIFAYIFALSVQIVVSDAVKPLQSIDQLF